MKSSVRVSEIYEIFSQMSEILYMKSLVRVPKEIFSQCPKYYIWKSLWNIVCGIFSQHVILLTRVRMQYHELVLKWAVVCIFMNWRRVKLQPMNTITMICCYCSILQNVLFFFLRHCKQSSRRGLPNIILRYVFHALHAEK